MPIRWRLSLRFTLLLCGILAITAVIQHFLLERYLSNQVDDTLRVYSARVHGTIQPENDADALRPGVIHSILPEIDRFTSPGIYIQIRGAGDAVIARSDSLGEKELPLSPSLLARGLEGSVAFDTVTLDEGTRLRIMASPIFVDSETLLLEVAQSLGHVDAALGQARWAFFVSIIVALLLAALLGESTVRGALAPVSRVTETARSIRANPDLSRRVDYQGPSDEIGQLANTFDDMLEQLENAFRSQKHFVTDASHELRSPLAIIRGNLDLLDRDPTDDERQESLDAIDAETARMTGIINDLLLLADVDSENPETAHQVSLKEVVSEEYRRARPMSGKRNFGITRFEDVLVTGNQLRLRQLLANLVDNAIRYTSEEDTVTISVYRDRDRAYLEVTDTGIGIDPEHLPHVFDRFYRTDKARSRLSGGTGLGLAIVKRIAEQHGGSVTVTSQPGSGTSVTVSLPARNSPRVPDGPLSGDARRCTA